MDNGKKEFIILLHSTDCFTKIRTMIVLNYFKNPFRQQ